MVKLLNEPVLKLSTKYQAAIGRIVEAWATFEHMLAMHLIMLTWTNVDAGSCLMAQFSFANQRLTALAALVHLYNGDKKLLRKISRFADETQKLAMRRNRIVHDPWQRAKNTGLHYRLEISAQRRLVFEPKAVEFSTLKALERDIRDHVKKFEALWSLITNDRRVRASWTQSFPPLSPAVLLAPQPSDTGSDEAKSRRPRRSSRA